MNVASIAAAPPVAVPAPFPHKAVDRARGILETARDRVAPLIKSGPTGNTVAVVRRDVMTAVRLLSRATNVDTLFHAAMSSAISNALDAVGQLTKVETVAKHVDNGLAQRFQVAALKQAWRSLDKAYTFALAGTHR